MNVLLIFKPDAVQRSLVGELLGRYEKLGTIHNIQLRRPARGFWYEHYQDHIGKPFFMGLIDFMLSGPVIVTSFGGAVNLFRTVTEQIRKEYQCQNPANLVHCSDSPEAAYREHELWFPE